MSSTEDRTPASRRRLIIIVAVILATGFGLLTLHAAWMPIFAYDAAQSYAYSFADAPGRRVPVSIAGDGFTLPASTEPWDTAVLRIDVATTLLGKWLTPSIDVLVDGSRVAVQYFEPGARGARFINLSALAALPQAVDHEVRLRGQHLGWKQHPSEILLFDNRTAPKPKIVVVSPHPDDAEIAAFGLYSRSDSRIITLTAGDSGGKTYGYLVPDDAQHYGLKGRLRVWDSLMVPQLGGVSPSHAVNLGYFDGTLRQMFEHPDEPVRAQHVDTKDVMIFRKYNVAALSRSETPRATWSSLVSDLTKLFTDAQPDIIVAPHPLLDAHPDHVFAGIAALEAVAAARLNAVKLYLYTNGVPGTDYFPFGPPDGVVGLPPWFDAKTPFSGIYSMPLSRDAQVLKLFALDAMHDVRGGPPGLEPNLKEDLRLTLDAIQNLFANLLGGDIVSFYRKAARPNELFFVYSGRNACELRRSFLLARGSNHASPCETEVPR